MRRDHCAVTYRSHAAKGADGVSLAGSIHFCVHVQKQTKHSVTSVLFLQHDAALLSAGKPIHPSLPKSS